MLEFEILARGLFRRHELDITYDSSLLMPMDVLVENLGEVGRTGASPAPTKRPYITMQEWIDTQWQQQLAIAHEQGFPLFDAPLLRLINVEVSTEGKLHLVL